MVTVATSEAAIPTAIAVHTCNDESEAIGLEKYTQRLKRRGEKSERSSRTSVLRTLMELRRGVTTTGLSNERTAPGSADSMVSPDNPARVTLDDGRTIEVTEVYVQKVEKQ